MKQTHVPDKLVIITEYVIPEMRIPFIVSVSLDSVVPLATSVCLFLSFLIIHFLSFFDCFY